MPGHMDKGTKNYRNMMKRMEGEMGEEKIPDRMNMGMDSLMPMKDDEIQGNAMLGMAKMGMDMAKPSMLDTDKESMMKMLQGMDFAPSDIKEAIETLMDMGFDKDAVLEILESTPNLIGAIGKPEPNPMTMPEGAISSQKRPMMKEMSGSGGALGGIPFDADRTQSMDMQKERMGT